MKKLIVWIFLLSLLTTPCYAQKSNYQLMLNAKLQTTKYPILEQEDEVFLSLQDSLSLMEGEYNFHFNEKDVAASITVDGQYSYFAEGHLFGVIRNKLIQLSAAPFFEQGELYLPASACARLTGHYFIKSKSYLQFFKW